MRGSIVFTRWQQCALPCGHICATWGIWLNLCFLRPTQVHSRNGKSIGSDVSAQLTAESPWAISRSQSKWHDDWLSSFHTGDCKVSLYFTMGAPFPPKLPLSMVGSGPPSNTWFFGPIWAHSPNGISIDSAVFAQMSAECPYTMGRPIPPSKLPLPMGDLDPHLIRGSQGPTKSSTQTASRSVQPFLQDSLVCHTDRPHYSVSSNRLHLCM